MNLIFQSITTKEEDAMQHLCAAEAAVRDAESYRVIEVMLLQSRWFILGKSAKFRL